MSKGRFDSEIKERIRESLTVADAWIGLGLQDADKVQAGERRLNSPFSPNSDSKSFSIYDYDKKFKYFAGGNEKDSGDVFTLIALAKQLDEKVDFPEILKIAGELAGIATQKSCVTDRLNKGRPKAEPKRSTYNGDFWEKKFREQLTEEHLDVFARSMGLEPECIREARPGLAFAADLKRLKVGGIHDKNGVMPEMALTFAERDECSNITAHSFRSLDGAKGTAKGSRRGLTTLESQKIGPRVCVEGASDLIAAFQLGYNGVSRPSNNGGARLLAEWIPEDQRTEFSILGENDQKENGKWPGRDGALKIKKTLDEEWGIDVPVFFPPEGSKDLREFVVSNPGEPINLQPYKPSTCASLYNAEKITGDSVVWITQGEESVKALNSLGFCSTAKRSSKAWSRDELEHLRGCGVVLCPNQDKGGGTWWKITLAALFKSNSERKIALCNIPKPHLSASEFVAGGGDRDTLESLVEIPEDQISFWKDELDWLAMRERLEEEEGSPISTKELKDGPVPSGINQFFAAAYHAEKRELLYDPANSTFYAYTRESGLWEEQSNATIELALGKTALRIIEKEGASSIEHLRNQPWTSQTRKLLVGKVSEHDPFRTKPDWIHLANGMLKLSDSGPELQSFCPNFRSRNRSSIPWDPDAECPNFLKQLLRPALGEADISLLQRIFGQALTGINSSQHILILQGKAGTGKSTVVNVLEQVIGRENVEELRIEHLANRFETSAFLGKTVLMGKDVTQDFLSGKAVGRLKSLVGGDFLGAELKNRGGARPTVAGTFSCIITSNSKLRVKIQDDEGAWRRRLLVVDYSMPPTDKPIPHLAQKLVESEGPGILRWLVEGALAARKELREGGIQITAEQISRVDEVIGRSSSIKTFVSLAVSKSQDHKDTVSVKELFVKYTEFCKSREWQSLSQRQFEKGITNPMKDLYQATRRNDISRPGGVTCTGFSGIVVKTQ